MKLVFLKGKELSTDRSTSHLRFRFASLFTSLSNGSEKSPMPHKHNMTSRLGNTNGLYLSPPLDDFVSPQILSNKYNRFGSYKETLSDRRTTL